MSETKPLTQWLQEDSEKWDDKNENADLPLMSSQSFKYGYNAGCAEAFRASSVRVEDFAATHLAEQAEPSAHDWKVANTAFPSDAEKVRLLAKLLMLKGDETAQRIRALLCGNS